MSMKNKDDAIPVVQGDTLIYQRGGQDCRLSVGTPAWYAWLSTSRTFAFRSAFGTFTVRKEQAISVMAGTGPPTPGVRASFTGCISASRRR